LARRVGRLFGQVESAAEMKVRIVEPPVVGVAETELAMCSGLCALGAQLSGGLERSVLAGDSVVPVPVPVEEDEQAQASWHAWVCVIETPG
jgi:hypothetical protein